MNLKCVFKQDHFSPEPHCDKEADYIFLGKSYCRVHFGIRSDEMKEIIRKQNESGDN